MKENLDPRTGHPLRPLKKLFKQVVNFTSGRLRRIVRNDDIECVRVLLHDRAAIFEDVRVALENAVKNRWEVDKRQYGQ